MTEQMEVEMASAEDIRKAAKIGSDEMANKVGKLLRQAESLPEGNKEREMFMRRALTLSKAYTIDLALARATQAKKERVEEVEARDFKVSDWGKGSRIKSGTKHMTELMMAICDAYDIKYLLSQSGMYVFARGFPSDLDMAERIFAILSVEMVTEADKALKRGANKEKRYLPVTRREEIPEDERAWGEEVPDEYGHYYAETEAMVGRQEENWDASRMGIFYTQKAPPTHRIVEVLDDAGKPLMEEKVVSSIDGRHWRANFYQSFISGIRKRLRDAKKQALADAGIDMADEASSGALALRDKKKEVEDEHEKYVLETEQERGRKLASYEGANVTRYSHDAHEKGQTAAERARLGDEKDVGKQSKRELG